jgi:hypothetical protein
MHTFILRDGRERSTREFTELLERRGFRPGRAEAIPAPVGVLEAVPVWESAGEE